MPPSFMKFSTLALLSWSLIANATAAGIICADVEMQPDGRFRYSYTIDNTTGQFPVVGFILGLEFPPAQRDWNSLATSDGGQVSVPTADWFADSQNETATSFEQLLLNTDPSGDSDVAPGQTLDGFSFASDLAPVSIVALSLAMNSAGDIVPTRTTTLGPGLSDATIPEPSTGLISIFLLGVASFRRR